MPKVPNPSFSYLHPIEAATLGLEEEYLLAAERRAAEKARLEREGPDNMPRKEVKRVTQRID